MPDRCRRKFEVLNAFRKNPLLVGVAEVWSLMSLEEEQYLSFRKVRGDNTSKILKITNVISYTANSLGLYSFFHH